MSKKVFYLPIFRQLQQVSYNNQIHTIEEVFIRRYEIFLKLSNITDPVNSEHVKIELTRFEII